MRCQLLRILSPCRSLADDTSWLVWLGGYIATTCSPVQDVPGQNSGMGQLEVPWKSSEVQKGNIGGFWLGIFRPQQIHGIPKWLTMECLTLMALTVGTVGSISQSCGGSNRSFNVVRHGWLFKLRFKDLNTFLESIWWISKSSFHTWDKIDPAR